MHLKQYAFADRLAARLIQDARVRAVWLEGSLGRGSDADAHSDIDLHILTLPTDEIALRNDMEDILSSEEAPLFYRPLPFGAMMAMALFPGLFKLEVWVEAGVSHTIPKDRAKVLSDPHASLKFVADVPPDSVAVNVALMQCMGDFWFGVSNLHFLWRGELIASVRGLGNQADYFVTMLILGRGEFRSVGGGRYNQFLEPDMREQIEAALKLPEVTPVALASAHSRLADLMRVHGRRVAYERGVAYPEALEKAVLDNLRRDFKAAGIFPFDRVTS